MHIKGNKLFRADGSAVPFEATTNKGGKLKNAKPRFVVLHYTANGSARSTVEHFKNKSSNVSAHLVVDHDGTTTQMVPFNERAWHAGLSSWKGLTGLNSYSVGIEIVNWGKLQGSRGNWRTWTGKPVSNDRVIEAAHRSAPETISGWEVFDEAQFDAVTEIILALRDAYGIAAADIVGHDDIAPRRKSDPGPAWDMTRFRSLVAGRADDGDTHEMFTVTAATGLNMRNGPGVEYDKIKMLNRNAIVSVIENNGRWWLVSEMTGDSEGDTGWVHSNWLTPV
jgi:N-acetylmuramoyl-L-alanine amidase